MWPNAQETAYLVTFTEENLNGKLHILYNASHELKKSSELVIYCLTWSMYKQNL